MSRRRRSIYHRKGTHRQSKIVDQILESTGLPTTGIVTGEINVGSQLRKMRLEREFTLKALAETSGLNVNTLSLIENGKSSPSVSTLQQLAGALQIPITAFFETSSIQKNIVFQEQGTRNQAAFDCGAVEDLGAGLRLGGGQPMLVTLDPGVESSSKSIVHTGVEFVFCLSGKLVYIVEDHIYQLAGGDSLIFKAHLPHRWGNPGTEKTQFLLVICPTDELDQDVDRHFDPPG